MNRAEFMMQLAGLLQTVPATEREEALHYYNEYFDDAGPEKEQTVIEELGSPAIVAENIRRDLSGNDTENAVNEAPSSVEQTAQGNLSVNAELTPQTSGSEKREDVPKRELESLPQISETSEKSKELEWWQITLIVIGGLIISPAALGLATGLLSTILGLIVGWFAMIFAFALAAIILLIVLVALVIAGIAFIGETPFVGLGLAGAGLVCGGIALLFLMLTVALAGIVTPAIFKALAYIFQWLRDKIERKKA